MEKSPGAAPPSSPPGAEEVDAARAEDAVTEQDDEEEDVAAPVVQVALKKGPWTAAEDAMLVDHVRHHGEGNWNAVQRVTGLLRCGKSCRLRWTNHLRPNLKKGSFSPDEELLIAQLHAQLGNKWARMAAHLPGRTDNEIKNYWNTRTKRRQRAGLPVYPPELQQLHVALSNSKRCRYDDFAIAPPPPTNVQAMDAAAAAAGYASSRRPAPLDLARQHLAAVTNHHHHQTTTLQFLPPPPFSAPSSPWANKPPFARNAQFFQLAHSSPVSPSTPTTMRPAATPDLSLGYGVVGERGGAAADQGSRLPLLSPSPGGPGPRAAAELPSNQYGHQPTSAAAATTAAGLGGGLALLPDHHHHQNAASLEKMLQELHDAIKVEPPELVPVPANGGGVSENSRFSGLQQHRADDMDTLFGLVPPALSSPETVPPPAAASNNHSGSTSQHSSEDQNPSLQVAGGGSSPDQDWGLDGVCQWSNMSRIC